MTRLVLTVIVLLTMTARAFPQKPAESGEVLTLEQAINAAQANNRLIKIADQSVLFSNDEILAARTQRYPHFNVDLTAGGLLTAVNVNIPRGVFGNVGSSPVPTTNSVITTEPKFSALSFIQVYQPLTQQYSAQLNIDLLRVDKQLSQEQLRQQRQQITNSVKQAYYSLLQTQSAMEAAEENLKALHEVERTTQEYVKQKVAFDYQESGVKVQLAQAELQLLTLQDNMQTQKENLNNLMGRDIRVEFRLSAVPDAQRGYKKRSTFLMSASGISSFRRSAPKGYPRISTRWVFS